MAEHCECDCHEYQGDRHCMWCHPETDLDKGVYVVE